MQRRRNARPLGKSEILCLLFAFPFNTAHLFDLFGEIEVVVGDVGDADDEDAHSAARAVYDSGGDMHEGAFAYGVFGAVE